MTLIRKHAFALVTCLVLIAITLVSTGCTPRMNFGVDLGMHDGELKARPHAGVDLYGRW